MPRRGLLMHRVVLLGFGLRVLYLDSQSLWFNETSSIYIARRGPLYIAQHLEADHVPLHFLLLYGWAGLAGLSEFAVRFLSVCAGVLTIPLLYQVLRLAGRRQLAVVGAGALALAPFHIYYSQEARMHVLACFFVTLAAYAQISAWQRHANARWALYGASAAAALYTWAYSGLALVGLNLALLLSRRRPRAWWLANVAAVLAIVPWTAIVASRFVSFIGDRVALAGQEPFGWADALRSTTMLAFGSTLDVAWALVPGGLLGLIGLACAFLLLKSGDIPERIFAGWAVGTVVCLDLLVLVLPIYDPRYLLVGLPGWIALIVAGIGKHHGLLRWASMPVALLFVIPSAVSLFNNYFDGSYQRPDYRDTLAKVRQEAGPDDVLIYDTPFQPWATEYYFADKPIPAVGLPVVRAKDGSQPDLAEFTGRADWPDTDRELSAASSDYDGIWLLLFGQPNLDPDNRVETWLDQHRLVVSNEWINGVRLKHYLPAPQPASRASLRAGGDRLNIPFGPFRLLEARVGRHGAAGRVAVQLLWMPVAPVEAQYSASLQLFDPAGQRVAQKDGSLLWGGMAAYDWTRGLAYYDGFALDLPALLPKGLYELRLSVYDAQQRLAGQQRTIAHFASTSPAVEVRPQATTAAGWNVEQVEVGVDTAGRLLVALTSKATAIPAKDYTWFVHALDSKGALVSQDDRPPLVPTSGWRPGEEHKDWFSLPAPSAPGAELEIGAYDAAAGRVVFQLPNGSRNDRLLVPIEQRLLTSRPNS